MFSLQTIIRLGLECEMLHHVEFKKKNLKEISRVSIVTQAGLDLVILMPHPPEKTTVLQSCLKSAAQHSRRN